MEDYLEFLISIFKKFLRVFFCILFILLSRYIGIYLSISHSNKMLLNIMSKFNPLINAKPILSYLPGEFAILGRTPLIYAISYGDYEAVDILLNNGADVNITSVFGADPLESCLKYGGKSRYKIAKLLVENGANSFENKHFIINLVKSSGLEDDDETQKYKYELFLNWMNKYYVYDKEFNYEIIYWAVFGNSIEEFLYMMNNYNIDINYKDSKDQYILISAVENRNVEFFKLLIDYGANINFADKRGKTIEDYILDEKYDEKYTNKGYRVIDYNKEKAEMLKILNEYRKNN